MKKITLLSFFFIFSGVFSQVTNEGEPLSWKFDNFQTADPMVLEEIDLQSLIAEDQINDTRRDIPWRFGEEIEVNFDLSNSGVWDVLENGDRIWRINIQSTGAKTLNFIFNDFYLPPGASLYLYNDERTDLLGAYTSIQNRPDRQLGTWFIDGDNVWLEYFEPRSQRGIGSLHLTKVVHGYRSVVQNYVNRGLNDSGLCNQDVNCSVGSDYDEIKEELKRSVALFLMGGSMCSGTLINNIENNNAPYFLTANHCDLGNSGSWAFRFNWFNTDPTCDSAASNNNVSYNQTASGATKLAQNPKSDFMLLNIDANLPSTWNLVWSGWNRSAIDIPDFTVGLHHPSGDIMKINRSNRPPSRASINFEVANTMVWKVSAWDIGVTEGGSSGSALFDQNGRIVGQLAGGASACIDSNTNGEPDFYGRFETSWDYGTTDNSRLSNWLDPNSTGAMTSDNLNTPIFQFMGNISIYPNPASTQLFIMNNNSSQLTYEFFTVTGQQIKADKLQNENNIISVDEFAEGVYFLKLFDNSSNSSLVKKIIVKR